MGNPNSLGNTSTTAESGDVKTEWDNLVEESTKSGDAKENLNEETQEVLRTGEFSKLVEEDGRPVIYSEYYGLPDKFKEQFPDYLENQELASLVSSSSFDLSMVDLFKEEFMAEETPTDKIIIKLVKDVLKHTSELKRLSQNGYDKEVGGFIKTMEDMGEAGEIFSAYYDVADATLDDKDTSSSKESSPNFTSIKVEVDELGEAVDRMSRNGYDIDKVRAIKNRFREISGSADPETNKIITNRIRQLESIESNLDNVQRRISSF